MADAIFSANVTPQGSVQILRKNLKDKPPFTFVFVMAEGEKVKHLLSIAQGMPDDLDPLPDHIKSTPFVIRFFPKKKGCALERTDARDSLPFRRSEIDELLRVVQMGVDMSINFHQQRGPARPGHIGANFLAHNEVV